eukprot:jgi/Mesen1/8729/ME000052S08156
MGRKQRPAPAERAFACLSRSFHDVQRDAKSDLKLMSSRAQHIKDIANSLDDWENIKLPLGSGKDISAGKLLQHIKETSRSEWESLKAPLSPGKELSGGILSQNKDERKGMSFGQMGLDDADAAGKLLQKIKDSSRALSMVAPSLEELELFRNLKDHVPGSFRRVQSDPHLPWLVNKKDGSRKLLRPPTRGQSLLRLDDWNLSQDSKKWQLGTENWEPLKNLKENLKELEVTAASSKTPTEFFHNMRKNLKLASPRESAIKAEDVAVLPLDVPELLENLVRQSEPLLDTLGVKKEVSTKVCQYLRRCKKGAQHARESAPVAGLTLVATPPPSPASGDSCSAEEESHLESRLASIVKSTGYRHTENVLGQEEDEGIEGKKRRIAIVTTATLPWMTGTAVNPLLRAAYLANTGEQEVTLVVPWLSLNDQALVYPNQMTFETPAEQEQYCRDWLHARVGFNSDFKIAFYPGKFSEDKRSILAVGDISSVIPDREADIAVLEEPEHLTWYYHGTRWTDKFQHVVGVIHTNYLEYVRREKNGALRARVLEHINNWMVRAYCHKVIRLSAATQDMPRSTVCNVHGVSSKFLSIGARMADEAASGHVPFSKGAYYLGKMVWSKGYRELVDLLAEHNRNGALEGLKVDVYGTGEDSNAVQAAAQQHRLRMKFHKGRDHADSALHQYKVFINPSMSDVVCTTTAEALAMGKIVVCADHPSNEFFVRFPNCYTFKTSEEFVEKVKLAMAAEPVPLSEEQRHLLTWEAATDRFLDIADINALPPKASKSSKRRHSSASSACTSSSSQSSSSLSSASNLSSSGADTLAAAGGAAAGASLKTLSLSMASPADSTELVDRGLALAHYVASGLEPFRAVLGAGSDTLHCGPKLSQELGLPPPLVQRPVYGW